MAKRTPACDPKMVAELERREISLCVIRAWQCLAWSRRYRHPATSQAFRRYAREWIAEGKAYRDQAD
jgi:hypothetical protein